MSRSTKALALELLAAALLAAPGAQATPADDEARTRASVASAGTPSCNVAMGGPSRRFSRPTAMSTS